MNSRTVVSGTVCSVPKLKKMGPWRALLRFWVAGAAYEVKIWDKLALDLAMFLEPEDEVEVSGSLKTSRYGYRTVRYDTALAADQVRITRKVHRELEVPRKEEGSVVTLEGLVAYEPRDKTSKQGNPFLVFAVKTGPGQYPAVMVWDPLAASLKPSLKKGTKVRVVGTLKSRRWGFGKPTVQVVVWASEITCLAEGQC
jgi:single-stranded DNA-binding protein